MDKRKIRDLLLLRPAMSSRNLKSLLLVAAFFGVYVASGGKVSSIPNIEPGQGFGTIGQEASSSDAVDGYDEYKEELEEEVEEIKPRKRKAKSPASSKRKTIEREASSDLIEDFDSSQVEDDDDLSSIEKRLNLGK